MRWDFLLIKTVPWQQSTHCSGAVHVRLASLPECLKNNSWLIWVLSNSVVSKTAHKKMIRSWNTVVTISHINVALWSVTESKSPVLERSFGQWRTICRIQDFHLKVQGWLFGGVEWAYSCSCLKVSKQTSEQSSLKYEMECSRKHGETSVINTGM